MRKTAGAEAAGKVAKSRECPQQIGAMMRYRSMQRRLFVSAVFIGVFCGVGSVQACSVPVFRYALERWPSDPYRVVIFYRGTLTKAQQQLVRDLSPEGRAGELSANVVLRVVNLDEHPDREMLALWRSQKQATLPWMVVRYPAVVDYAPAWAGPLSRTAVETLLDSPVRREIAKRLLSGQTAVWILLESGDRVKDEAAYKTLVERLAEEQRQLRLPEIDEQDLLGGEAAKEEVAKLRIEFSVIRLSRNDPREKMVVEMLLGSEGSGPDSLRDPQYVNQTMAFPIFGRGRIRYGLVGAGIADDTIHEACAYLCGPCKCQIKEGVENRGMDLVMAVNWDRLVAPTIRDKPDPPLFGLGKLKPIQPVGEGQPSQPVIALKPKSGQPQNASVALAARNHPSPLSADNPGKDRPDSASGGVSPAISSENNSPEKNKPVESSPSAGGDRKTVDAATPLYRNVFLLFGVVAVMVVGASFFLARRGG